jgi:hypothetical protein
MNLTESATVVVVVVTEIPKLDFLVLVQKKSGKYII